MSNILKVKFPKDFNEKYQKFRAMLLNALKEKEPEEKTESAELENQIPGDELRKRLGFIERITQEKALHSKIETAKKLLLKEGAINNKTHSFPSLNDDFHLSKGGLISLADDGLIVLKNYFINQFYINEYEKRRGQAEAQREKILVASMSYGSASTFWKNPFADKHCGLGKAMYSKLKDELEMELDGFSFRGLVTNNTIAVNFIKFDVEFSPEALQEFLNEKVDLFIKDELDLADEKHQMHFGYQKQKEQFSVAINRQLKEGYPPNNLKIDFTKIWAQKIILQTDFLETALGMEREGLIEVKDIIKRGVPDGHVVMTSDDFWKYPTIIQLKVLDKFYPAPPMVPTHQNTDLPEKESLPAGKELKPEILAGKLGAYPDGTIRYGGTILKMRNQLKDLCRLFMAHPNQLVIIDTIKDELIRADRRESLPFSTISKYVSELHTSLKIHFGKDVIFNQKEEGWYFKP